MPSNKIPILLFLFLGLANVGIANAENRVILSPGLMYFDYEERGDNGAFLDGETGSVLGATIALERSFNSKFSAILFGGIYTGTVNYDGHTQIGDPIQTDTQADFFTFGVEAQLPLAEFNKNFYLITGYRYKRWERDIQPVGSVSGLFEVYQWQEFSLGVQLFSNIVKSTQWSIFGGFFQTRNAEIEINLASEGYGKPSLSLGSDTGFEFGIQHMDFRNNEQDMGFRFSYRTWKFGRSPNEIASGSGGTVLIHEPRSETSTFLFEVIIPTSN